MARRCVELAANLAAKPRANLAANLFSQLHPAFRYNATGRFGVRMSTSPLEVAAAAATTVSPSASDKSSGKRPSMAKGATVAMGMPVWC